MKHKILPFLVTVVFLGGCSSAYKSSQTPDDVYYSPARGVSEKEAEKKNKQNDRYEEYVSSNDARYMRMKAHNYSLWNSIDDYSYWNDSRYHFSRCTPSRYSIWTKYNNCGCNNNYYNGYTYYNGGGYYNAPISYVIGYKNPKTTIGSNSGSYLSTYKNNTYNNANYNAKGGSSQSGFGALVRQVFAPASGSSNSSSSSWDRPARTFSPTTSSTTTSAPATSSSAGGSSGGYGSTGSSSSAPRATRQ